MLGFNAIGERAPGDFPSSRPVVPVVHGTQANFAFNGATYTYPATSFSFGAPPLPQVAGWKAANFGAPSLLPHAVGFKAANFGTPRTTVLSVSGFLASHFGSPGLANFYQVTGFAPVLFGAPTLARNVLGFKATNFGIGSLALNVVGFASTHFGAPASRNVNRVTSFRACRFGISATPTNRSRVVRGFNPVNYGYVVALKYTPTE